jgi:hypothetical protein
MLVGPPLPWRGGGRQTAARKTLTLRQRMPHNHKAAPPARTTSTLVRLRIFIAAACSAARHGRTVPSSTRGRPTRRAASAVRVGDVASREGLAALHGPCSLQPNRGAFGQQKAATMASASSLIAKYQGVDTNGTAMKMMKTMGWKEGKGIGANDDGMTSHIHVKKRREVRPASELR